MFQTWRRFQFFEKTEIKETNSSINETNINNISQTQLSQNLQSSSILQSPTSSSTTVTLQKLVITSSSSGRGKIILGDGEGFLNIVERDFNRITSFRVYERTVTVVYQLKQSNIFITIGDDEESINPTLKIWNFDKLDKDGNPMCLKILKIFFGKGPAIPATCLSVLEDLSLIAVGLCNGEIILFRGSPDLLRDKSSKQIILKVNPNLNDPVTGLGFRDQRRNLSNNTNNNANFSYNSIVLFVSTSNSVCAFYIHDNEIQQKILDDIHGCGINCMVMSDEGDMIIGRKEAVYFYEVEDRGPCFGFEGEKKILSWFRNYLIIVGQDINNLKYNTFTIYDLKNKFIAYSENRFPIINQVLSEWGCIFILTSEGKVYQLEEKDTSTKLETLFKKNLYSVAINLAYSQNYDYASIIDIFRRYGDHLYSKGDFDGAMNQYIRTIGKLEPSYVIRKFLDAQRIHNLTSYLQALHEKGLANADHTTLLFNCYTKLKDVKKLDEFIKTEKQHNFEIETAIKACRQAGYYEHALYLAKKHNQHDWYLKILLEDIKGFNEALEYIGTLDFFEAEKNLKKYGKTLVTNLPEKTTALLMKLCTNYKPQNIIDNKLEELDNNINLRSKLKSNPDEFIHIFVNQPEWLTKFLEVIISKSTASNLVYTTLLELYLRNDEKINELKKQKQKKAYELLTNPQAKFDDDHALVLCKMNDFREGLLYLYEKSALYHEIIQYYFENNEYDNIIQACKKYGDKDPNLWIQVLSYFASKEEDCQKEIMEVLGYIDRDNLLPPLLVIQILSEKKTATLSLIKDYIIKRLQQENQLITEDQKQIRNYKEETKKMRNEIYELKTSAKIFQLNKCTYCSNLLDLPAIHFLCMHSFHQRCLGENENECPVCTPQNRKILEIKRSLEENAGQHDQFFKQLEGSLDGFSTVSEYFSKGIFQNKISILNEGKNLDKNISERELLFENHS